MITRILHNMNPPRRRTSLSERTSGLTDAEHTQAQLLLPLTVPALLNKLLVASGVHAMGEDEVSALQAVCNMLDKRTASDAHQLEQDEISALRAVHDMLAKRVEDAQVCDNRSSSFEIEAAGFLEVEPDVFAEIDERGENEHWSANGLFQHLELLERLVSRTNETAARLWTNAFFYRVAAMLPTEYSMVLNVTQDAPAVSLSDSSLHAQTVSGTVNWTAVATSEASIADEFKYSPHLSKLRKGDASALLSPRCASARVAWGESSPENTIRGALTNGHDWIFLLPWFDGAKEITYLQSRPLTIEKTEGFAKVISKESVTVISAILAHWMIHSHEDIRDDDYLVIKSYS
ncbi:hypothetical protein D9619_009589 [Psilocybe cf. subviscida]|uniref:Uncharacterized protein n=1 Tax=Psilocybe cf. subviscida TaxID=2480587 RepID=A0A8H5F6A7_9AGAR|nr:hypothetical protein D9619_009589 [Psilocybe cf. subviscida]